MGSFRKKLDPLFVGELNMFPYKNNNFDMIRLMAAFQVAVAHTQSHLEVTFLPVFLEAIWGFFPGVPIFFFVSGFLISMSFERCHSNKIYAANRVLRIYPALLVCLIISILSVVLSGYSISDGDFFAWLAAQATIVQFYNPDFLRGYGVGVLNGSLWTIPVELSFYLLLPLIYYVGNKLKQIDVVLLFLFLLSLLADAWHEEYYMQLSGNIFFKLFHVSLIPYLWMFLLGALFQRFYDVLHRFVAGKSTIFFILYLLLALFLLSFAISMNGKPGKWLGGNDISYGIYIYHMVVVNIFLHQNAVGSYTVAFIALFVTTLLAYLSWKVVERPALRLKQRSIHKV